MRATIRPFEERDNDAVIALSLRAWAPAFASIEGLLGESGIYAEMHPDWRADQTLAVRTACRAAGMRVWVAELDTIVAGFVAARLDERKRVGEIHMVAVDPAHQRNGIGSLLTSHALEWFRDNGMALAMVETGGDASHAPARRTYERAGFLEVPISRYFMKL